MSGDTQLWEARDEYGGPVLLKTWPFQSAHPSEEERTLWKVELRNLFRLSSIPEADRHLAVLRDAGVDTVLRVFVLVLTAPGVATLEELLQRRPSYQWLRDLADPIVRADLWVGLKYLAVGLTRLHEQQMLHRAVSASSVIVDAGRGPASMRLGGFEWTIRLGGEPPVGTPPLPPSEGAYSFETDWFLFGHLAARILAPSSASSELTDTLDAVACQVWLTGEEKEFIFRLLDPEAKYRLTHGGQVATHIDLIVSRLQESSRRGEDDYLALIALIGPQRALTQSIIELEPAIHALDTESQRAFIEADLSSPRVVRWRGAEDDSYVLVGSKLSYMISEYDAHSNTAGSWILAHCSRSIELRSSGEEDQITIREAPVRVFTSRAMVRDEAIVRRGAATWKPFLPRRPDGVKSEVLKRLHDFFRVTNQIELLMRDSEIFAYEVVGSKEIDGLEELTLKEGPRARGPGPLGDRAIGMAEYLIRQMEEARDGDLVYLGPEETLSLRRRVPRTECWKVIIADQDDGRVVVRRLRHGAGQGAGTAGFLRSFGLFGQMAVNRRRRRSIEKLGNHSYLLRAINNPDFSFLDTGDPLPIEPAPERVDRAKRMALSNIWRTRPLFALQGPPGTGKTTLVAHLLKQIFLDDPGSQVLVAAQAHSAVDVLRDKVSSEFLATSIDPLVVRLRRTADEKGSDPDYVEQVAYRILEKSVETLGRVPDRSGLQGRWLEAALEGLRAIIPSSVAPDPAIEAEGDGPDGLEAAAPRSRISDQVWDFCELVKRSANITYSTTTSGSLAELCNKTQSFDWTVIEEAGKAHGFELALPLLAGHRWLLIGDQAQLPPYRIDDFRRALLNLDDTFRALRDLPGHGSANVDLDLLLGWQRLSPEQKAIRANTWRNWLKFFETLHRLCLRAAPFEEVVGPPISLGAMLYQQHRMHPVIADLVSTAYYEGKIVSMTLESNSLPMPRVVHPFVAPAAVEGKAIVWIDTGAATASDAGGVERSENYVSQVEAEATIDFLQALRNPSGEPLRVAVLSPYRRQVTELGHRLRALTLPDWLIMGDPKAVRPRRNLAATVDSFQGDQADVVIVSLVRDNDQSPGLGLGFLRESERLNVLFSRAERLLVLVGNWDFFQRQLEGVPADYAQPLGHLRLALDYINSSIESGLAARICALELR